MSVRVIGLTGLPEVRPGDDLASLLVPSLTTAGLRTGDVVVVTSKIVSKAEGRLVPGPDRAHAVEEETRRVVARRGSEHCFADLDPAKTALVVVDLRNAFMMDGVGHATRPDASCSASNAPSSARARRRFGVTATAPSASEARIARFTPVMVSER